jgi:hypothetical protein
MNGGIGIAATTHLEQQRRCNPPKIKILKIEYVSQQSN